MSAYLDAEVARVEMSALQVHLDHCIACSARCQALRRTQAVVGRLGRKPAPPDLALKLRVALSQELARTRRSRWDLIRVRWENALDAVMVPVTGGLVTTILTFGLLINLLVPGQVARINDVPTTLFTPPELQSTPFEVSVDANHADPLIVEAVVGADGRVQDYRVLSGGDSGGAQLAALKNVMIFATFRPATSFGRPTVGRAILAFSKIQVKG
jgi:hypothetical protein